MSIMEILNHPRILRCVDESQLEIPSSLRPRIITAADNCSRFGIIFFIVVLKTVDY
jgi:hypothetical protein